MAETEPNGIREVYESALRRRRFDDPDRVHVVFGVYTTDLSEGRGDVYVAVGLGRHLERHGYEVVYLDRHAWYDPPEGTDIFISLLAEPTVMLEPLRLDPSIMRVAWVRNNTTRWVRHPHTPLYDRVLAASERSRREIGRVYPGQIGSLSIGVDAGLFRLDEGGSRAGVVSTVNQWGDERQLFSALRRIDVDFPLTLYGTLRGLDPSLDPYADEAQSYFVLPDVYRRSALVLDDQQDVNRGYGSVNSRVFEALSCGALPITNTRLGLDAIGLEDVPSYDRPQDLGALVRDFLGDEERRRELVEQLRSVVLERHTYEHRAAALHEFLTGSGGAAGTASRATFPVVGFVPDYSVTNPYQRMLYARTVEAGAAAVPVPGLDRIRDMSRLIGERLVLHVHWTAPVLGPAADRADARWRADEFLGQVEAVRAAGGKVIWTVHNLLPHDGDHLDVEADLRRRLAERADVVHVMCEGTVDLAAAHYPIPSSAVRVIPHPSYVDVYPNVVTRERARATLDIDGEETVLLFFGQVRPYKGLEELLDAFGELDGAVRLLIAGNPGREPAVRQIVERIEHAERVDPHLRVIPDEELQTYLAATDIAVLPYRAALNSGALHLALTFGRPVVAPRVGCLGDSLTPETGVLYDPEPSESAPHALAGALRLAIERFGGDARYGTEQACYAAANANTYLDAARDFADLIAEMNGGTPREGTEMNGGALRERQR